MKKETRFTGWALFAAVLLAGNISASMTAQASKVLTEGTCGDTIKWTYDDAGLLKISGTGEMYSFKDKNYIPADLDIKRIEIENGVTTIGDYFMADSRIRDDIEIDEVKLPATLEEVGSHAFDSTYVDEIHLPDSIEVIDDYAFYNCSGWRCILEDDETDTIYFPRKLETIGDYAFASNVEYPSTYQIVLLEGTESIGKGAFGNMVGLTLVVPNSVKEIGDDNNIFKLNHYGSKVAQEAVNRLSGLGVASDTALTGGKTQNIKVNAKLTSITSVSGEVDLEAENDRDGGDLSFTSSNTKVATVDDDGIITALRKGTTVITITAEKTSKYKETVKKVTITVKNPSVGTVFAKNDLKFKITKVGKYVSVSGLTDKTLETVSIPKTVSVGGVKYKVTEIAAKAFKNCTALKSVSIDSTYLTTIGKEAFRNDKALKEITIKTAKLKSVGKNTFYKISADAVIRVPKTKLKAYKKLMKKKGQSATVVIQAY